MFGKKETENSGAKEITNTKAERAKKKQFQMNSQDRGQDQHCKM